MGPYAAVYGPTGMSGPHRAAGSANTVPGGRARSRTVAVRDSRRFGGPVPARAPAARDAFTADPRRRPSQPYGRRRDPARTVCA
ncbi:hypothetical protein, partial [Streptomyces griseus]|uniref:hypothetical protein n=1 Tax=Streptomyces griseus TaxID=1911 RepID=UPI0036C564F4